MIKTCPVCGRLPSDYIITGINEKRFCYECPDFFSATGRNWEQAEKSWNQNVTDHLNREKQKGEDQRNERRKTIAWKRIYQSKAGAAANH